MTSVGAFYVLAVTGTRFGATEAQHAQLEHVVKQLAAWARQQGLVPAGQHGDCVGVDAQFDALCQAEGMTTACWPCLAAPELRAGTGAEPLGEPVRPMQRNRELAKACDVMLACPPNFERIKKGSGTWATIGFARREGKRTIVIFPDGSVDGPESHG